MVVMLLHVHITTQGAGESTAQMACMRKADLSCVSAPTMIGTRVMGCDLQYSRLLVASFNHNQNVICHQVMQARATLA